MELPLPFTLAMGLTTSVWMLVLALRLPTLYACLGLLGAIACFGPDFAKWNLGPLTASPDRLGFILVVGLVGLKRVLTWQPRLSWDRSDFLLAALLALISISIATHSDPPHTSPRTPSPGFMLLTTYLCPAVFYWIARFRPVQSSDARRIAGFFVIFGIYLSFTAVCESQGIGALVFPKYILQQRLHYEGRSVGPFLSAPALGTWLTVATACAVLLCFEVRGISRTLVMGLLPLFAYAEYLTQTRSAWMGYIVAVPLVAVLRARSMTRHMLMVGLVLIGSLGGLFAGERFIFPERKEGRGVVAHSADQRLFLLQKSLSLFVQRPIFGWGFGQFEYAARVHGGGGPLQLVVTEDTEKLASHNLFLRSLAELGVVGFSLQILILGGWVGHARHVLRFADHDSPQRPLAILCVATLCAYVAEAMFHDVTFIPPDNMLVFFTAGAMGLRYAARESRVGSQIYMDNPFQGLSAGTKTIPDPIPVLKTACR